VFCQPYFPFEASKGLTYTIADVPTGARFSFFQGKLYAIDASFAADQFSRIKDALKAKYGPPTSEEKKEYQNGFGATYSGGVVVWDNPVSSITLVERCTNLNSSCVMLQHKALGKAVEAAKPTGTSTDI
jgi:hypothetical protein